MIPENLKSVESEIAAVCKAIGRNPKDITLVGVTKYGGVAQIEEALNAGLLHIGENRVQDAAEKFPVLKPKFPKLTCHLIGHLQTNKVKDAVKLCDVIQSVDSLKLAQEIEKQAAKISKTVNIFVQVNTSGEAQKFGIDKQGALKLIADIAALPQIRIIGLMTIAPDTEDQDIIRQTFRDLRLIRDTVKDPRIQMKYLSMGMSGDFKIALEEGSNMVRIGSAIFVKRISTGMRDTNAASRDTY